MTLPQPSTPFVGRADELASIARLLAEGPRVLATGGGAFMHPETRGAIRAHGISIWLRAELPVLMRRVAKRDTRPLLRTQNPEATMRALMDARYPVYSEADITVESRDDPHEVMVNELIARLAAKLAETPVKAETPAAALRPES